MISDLKPHYRTGRDDLRKDFFTRCLADCTTYERAAGYFSSTALLSWADALRIPKRLDELRIKLLISPALGRSDLDALRTAIDPQQRVLLVQHTADQVVLDVIELLKTTDTATAMTLQAQILAWLIANDRLALRFAIPDHIEDAGIFHEKIGIFTYPDGSAVAFSGSANETYSGHTKNYESIDVYRSWIPADEQRVKVKIDQFNEAWEGSAEGLLVFPLSEQTLAVVREYAPTNCPITQGPAPKPPDKWAHQDQAVQEFLNHHRGVLEMATGTGKTKTAIKALTILQASGKVTSVIITTDGTDLLDQWTKEMDDWALTATPTFRVYRHYADQHDMASFANNPEGAIIVISRGQLARLFALLKPEQRKRMLMIHDEVHGLGSPANRAELVGQHQAFPYCLGLSATPEREYDADGTAFITSEIGPVIFQFGLEDAINKGILCDFDYVALPYQLTDGDKQRLAQVYAREAARKAAGDPMTQEEVWIELAKVYKTAEQKPGVFAAYLNTGQQAALKSSIIFVEDKNFGERVINVIAQHTYKYRTYYAEDDRANLLRFAKGEIDCLLTCHRISQGIDIRGLRTVVLFSSARSRLETIQRIGRCLRTDPNTPYKRALVIDFVRDEHDDNTTSPDDDRQAWLSALAQIRPTI